MVSNQHSMEELNQTKANVDYLEQRTHIRKLNHGWIDQMKFLIEGVDATVANAAFVCSHGKDFAEEE